MNDPLDPQNSDPLRDRVREALASGGSVAPPVAALMSRIDGRTPQAYAAAIHATRARRLALAASLVLAALVGLDLRAVPAPPVAAMPLLAVVTGDDVDEAAPAAPDLISELFALEVPE
jgi:hypothetical protein